MSEFSKESPDLLLAEPLPAFLNDLKELDGTFGPIGSWSGMFVSNDTGFKDIATDVIPRIPQERSGIGIFVGGGGAFSLLPDLPVEAIALIDNDSNIGDFNQILADTIVTSDGPEEVFARIKSDQMLGRHALLRELKVRYFDDMQNFVYEIVRESHEFGPYHWSDPARYPLVKEVLAATPLVTVSANITHPEFGAALRDTLAGHGKKINFANFTNVHAWVGAASMQFLQDVPFDPQAPVLYSSLKDAPAGHWPIMMLAPSVGKYLKNVEELNPW